MASILDMIKTTPYHNRFPAMNQSPHCWNRYNEWVMCLKTTENDEDKCKQMRQFAESICPDEWKEKWDEEREAGGIAFQGVGAKEAKQAAQAHH